MNKTEEYKEGDIVIILTHRGAVPFSFLLIEDYGSTVLGYVLEEISASPLGTFPTTIKKHLKTEGLLPKYHKILSTTFLPTSTVLHDCSSYPKFQIISKANHPRYKILLFLKKYENELS